MKVDSLFFFKKMNESGVAYIVKYFKRVIFVILFLLCFSTGHPRNYGYLKGSDGVEGEFPSSLPLGA